MKGPIKAGDMVVSRVNGTQDWYVVGRVVSSANPAGLNLVDVQPLIGRDAAIRRGYERKDRTDPSLKVWLFDGMEATDLVYGEAPEPADRG